MKKLNYKKIISLVLAALTILFILQNIAVINISFLFWTFFISRSVLIFSGAFGRYCYWLAPAQQPQTQSAITNIITDFVTH